VLPPGSKRVALATRVFARVSTFCSIAGEARGPRDLTCEDALMGAEPGAMYRETGSFHKKAGAADSPSGLRLGFRTDKYNPCQSHVIYVGVATDQVFSCRNVQLDPCVSVCDVCTSVTLVLPSYGSFVFSTKVTGAVRFVMLCGLKPRVACFCWSHAMM
jgi:hypothetical protein